MNERIRILKADLTAIRQVIGDVYTTLERYPATRWDEEKMIVVAYHLHNLYAAFEDAFQRVAETFENDVPDRARWHAQLLRRMTLDIEEIRPHLVSRESYEGLDELRRFRHVFRTAYAVSLYAARLKLVHEKVQRLRSSADRDFDRFFAFLDELDRPQS